MMVLFGQSSGPVEPFDPQMLNQKGSLFLTRPTLGHYTATRAELLERAGRGAGLGGRRLARGADRARVPAGAGGRRAPGARGPAHDGQGAAHSVSAPAALPALVSTEWLAERLGRPGLRVLDASWYLPTAGRDAARRVRRRPHPGRRLLRSRRRQRPRHHRCRTCCPRRPHSRARWPRWACATRTTSSSTTARARTSAPRARGGCSGCSVTRAVAVLDGGLGKWRREGRAARAGRGARFRPAASRRASIAPRSGTSPTIRAQPRGRTRADRGHALRGPVRRDAIPSRAPGFAAATSPAAGACPTRSSSPPMARCSRRTRSAGDSPRPASTPRARSSPPAARARVPAPSSSRSTCWATTRRRCTTARGPSGADATDTPVATGPRMTAPTVRTDISPRRRYRVRLRGALPAAVRGGRRVRGGAAAPRRRMRRLGAGRVPRHLRAHLRRRGHRGASSRCIVGRRRRGGGAGARGAASRGRRGSGGRTGPRAGSPIRSRAEMWFGVGVRVVLESGEPARRGARRARGAAGGQSPRADRAAVPGGRHRAAGAGPCAPRCATAATAPRVLELATLPAPVGHALEGTVRTPAGLRPAEGFRVVLSCIRRVTSGSGRRPVHVGDGPVAGGAPDDGRGGAAIPVAFAIPARRDAERPGPARTTGCSGGSRSSARCPAWTTSAAFEVPVFRTAASDAAAHRRRAGRGRRGPPCPADYRQPAGSRIQVSDDAGAAPRSTSLPRGTSASPAGLTAFVAHLGRRDLGSRSPCMRRSSSRSCSARSACCCGLPCSTRGSASPG